MVRLRGLVLMLLLMLAASSFGYRRSVNMRNTDIIFEDSTRVDSTETVAMMAFGIDHGADFTVLIEARDDSSAGFSADSASVSMKVYQVWPVAVEDEFYFVRLESRAHPDSTTSLLSGGPSFTLFDSLDILEMDTASGYFRDYVGNTAGNRDEARHYGDSLVTLDTLSNFGAMAYTTFVPDVSPALQFEFTGTSGNKVEGVGSMWKVRVYQLKRTP